MDGNIKNTKCVHVSTRQPDGMWWVWQDLIIVLWGPLFSSLGGSQNFQQGLYFPTCMQLYDQVTKFRPMGSKKCFTLFAAFHLGFFVPCLELASASGAPSWNIREELGLETPWVTRAYWPEFLASGF